jgi:isoquinoline 1-oxidoreductase beta subunit
VGGGLLIGCYVRGGPRLAEAATPGKTFAPNAFIRIGADGVVTIIVGKSEMGQGVYTSLPMLVAEELEADWRKIRVESAPVDPAYNHPQAGMQFTGGSQSVSSSWDQLRKAGAAARIMLIAAAAQTWKVGPGDLRAENGYVVHGRSGRRLSYGALAGKAVKLAPPKDVKLKEPKDFKIIGKPMRRLDSPEKVTGKGQFGLDVKLPGMLTALVARPPVFGGKALNVRDDKARAVPGVKAVVLIPSGVAVVATGFWPAKQGRDALEIQWDDGPGTSLSTASLREQYASLAKTAGAAARKEGDAAAALAQATRQITAEYEVPFLAHAPMEPLNCVVDLRPGSCELWTGTQFQTVDRAAAAAAAGLRPEQVKIHTTLLGGGFGRRANPASDFVAEAVHVAKAVQAPVKVVWTREDDMRGGYYRPVWFSRLSAGWDAGGNPVAWMHTIVGQSILAGTPFEKFMVKDGIDATSVEGAADLPYDIPNIAVDLHSPRVGVPVLWWRSVGHSHTAFVVESFLDEVAHAAGKDPYELRRALLSKHPRHAGVLELAAGKAGWGTALPAGRGRGIAVHESFRSFVAHVAEVSVQDGRVRVHRVVCAIDCGMLVNPDTIKAQMESGIVFGLTAALHGAITLKDGRVEQSNFHDYPMLRMNEMPAIEVHIAPSTEAPGGVGEPGVPPIAPAVANALFAATGKRVRRLPIGAEELKAG